MRNKQRERENKSGRDSLTDSSKKKKKKKRGLCDILKRIRLIITVGH